MHIDNVGIASWLRCLTDGVDNCNSAAEAVALRASKSGTLAKVLHECRAYFDRKGEVVDGPHGEPVANEELALFDRVTAALKAAGEDV